MQLFKVIVFLAFVALSMGYGGHESGYKFEIHHDYHQKHGGGFGGHDGGHGGGGEYSFGDNGGHDGGHSDNGRGYDGHDGGHGVNDGGNGGGHDGDHGGHNDGHESHDFHSEAKYEYEYGVKDHKTGDNKKAWETRHGDVVKGGYEFYEADGTKRIVEYTADKHNGFNAVVKKVGHAYHPQIYGHGHGHEHEEHGHEHGGEDSGHSHHGY